MKKRGWTWQQMAWEFFQEHYSQKFKGQSNFGALSTLAKFGLHVSLEDVREFYKRMEDDDERDTH